jgi:hypothetical protein
VALPPSDSLSCGLVSHTKEINYTQNLQNRQPDGLKGQQLKYGKDKRLGITDKPNVATWNARGLGMNELELEKILEAKQVQL